VEGCIYWGMLGLCAMESRGRIGSMTRGYFAGLHCLLPADCSDKHFQMVFILQVNITSNHPCHGT